MGDFITAEELKNRTQSADLISMDTDLMEDRYIVIAERAIENQLRLNLNTNGQPRHWQARFQSNSNLETQFRNDYKTAVTICVERLADNPNNYQAQQVRGASVTYDRDIVPSQAFTIMKRWKRPRRVGRG